MSQKLLVIIQQFSESDLTDFLKRNGYSEFEEILVKGEVTNGEKFLSLNELQIIKWKLPLATKRKLMSFLTEIKTNPQKFLGKAESDKHATVSRRQSFVRINTTNTSFKEKLEQVITMPKPTEAKPIKKTPPSPMPVRKPLPPTPPNEYLPMDIGKSIKVESPEDHYDESGYLLPLALSKDVEENDYEPSPSNEVITQFTTEPITRISQRAPLALPRGSTDERGYIRGPEDLASPIQIKEMPPLFPRVQKSVPLKSHVRTPSPASYVNSVVQDDTETEEEVVDYEPIDDDDDVTSLSPQPESSNTDIPANIESGTISRWLSFLKKGRKPDVGNLEQNELKASSLEEAESRIRPSRDKSPISPITNVSLERQNSLNPAVRPLPPLPGRQPTVVKEVRAKPLDGLRVYENVKNHTTSAENLTTENTLKVNKSEKSKSETDLVSATDEPDVTYGNVEENPKPQLPESYEHFHVEQSKFGKRVLPLPPNTLPQLPLPPNTLPQLLLPPNTLPQLQLPPNTLPQLQLPSNTLPQLQLPPNTLPQIRKARQLPLPGNHDLEEESTEYDQYIFNINDEPFYRNTDRKGARLLLFDLDDGAFLFRPSKRFFLTLSLKYNQKFFNLGVEKTQNNKIRLNTHGDNMSPEFATIKDFIAYFTREYLTFQHQGKLVEMYLRKLLPPDRF